MTNINVSDLSRPMLDGPIYPPTPEVATYRRAEARRCATDPGEYATFLSMLGLEESQ